MKKDLQDILEFKAAIATKYLVQAEDK